MNIEQHRFRVLDSWRGICACLVALFHFRTEIFSHLYQNPFIEHSGLWVDFFFVLSGFVIFANYGWKLGEGYGFWRFMVLRFGRVYPLHFFIIMGLIGVEVLQMVIPQLGSQPPFGGEDNRLVDLPAQFLLLQGMGVSDRLSFNFPSWTISAEFYSYAFFALLIIIFRKRINLVLPLVALAAGAFMFHQGTLISHYQYGFIRCVYSFALGAMIWRAFELGEKKTSKLLGKNKFLPHIVELLIVAALIAAVTTVNELCTVFIPLLFAAAIWVFAFEKGIVSRVLKTGPFLLLGALSYSIYMLHHPILTKVFGIVSKVLYKIFPGHETMVLNRMVWGDVAWQGDLIAVVFLLVVIAASAVTYLVIEMPCRNYFRKVASKMKKPA